MIRRRHENDLLLITQHEHALLAGQLARRIGNGSFAPPQPIDSVLTAISQHDSGWQSIDAHPSLNPDGLPAHVFETDIELATVAWAESVERLHAADPYAALLVSLHVMNLAAHAATSRAAVKHDTARRETFCINRFLHQQIETQEALRNELHLRVDLPLHRGLAEPGRSEDEDQLSLNFHTLQLMDQLSLTLCFNELISNKVRPIQPRSGAWPLTIRVDRRLDGAVRLDPWPFDVDWLELSIPAKRLRGWPYKTDAALQVGYTHAEPFTAIARLRSRLNDRVSA